MNYIDHHTLAAISAKSFKRAQPFPWVNPQGLLTESGFDTLCKALPDVSLFEKRFGKKRDHGQYAHDRYSLEYDENLPIDPVWHEFVNELRGREYTRWVKKLFGAWAMRLSFHWHYTPNGCSVSPHCDSRIKLGSQIFYFNTDADWQPEWGGETVVLDDHKQFNDRSSPAFEEFFAEIPAQTMGNRSLLFKRTNHAWHGVREIHCPEDRLRKVFIVVMERVRPIKTLRNAIREKLAA